MQLLTESFIRSSFINASRKEVKDMTLPAGFDELTEADWQAHDVFGWRDPKFARRAYVIIPQLDGDPIGIALKQAESSARARAMCNWCRDVRLPNEVALWSAKRTGDAGRRGNTVATLACLEFQCSRDVRNDMPPAYEGYDVVAARERRIDELQLRAAGFAEGLLNGG